MGETVYADVLFLINFSMDFLCFYICSHLLCIKLRLWRTTLASALGGIYSVAALFIPACRIGALLLDLSVMLGMVALAIPRRDMGRNRYIISFPLYAAVAAALGGAMTAIYNLFNSKGFGDGLAENGGEDHLTLWGFALLAASAAAATLCGGRRIKLLGLSDRASVEITNLARSVSLEALVDSGNLLTDPIGGRQVMLCELAAVEPILPPEVTGAIKSGGVGAISDLPPELLSSIRLIPAASASGEAMLIALKVDELRVNGGETDLLLAPVKGRLRAAGCSALLPPGII